MSRPLITSYRQAGLRYLMNIIVAIVLGGSCAVIVSANRLDMAGDLIGADRFYHFLSLHGMIMIFLVLVPLIPATVGNFMLGGKIVNLSRQMRTSAGHKETLPESESTPDKNTDLRFPRLVTAGWLAHGSALILMAIAMISGGLDTGWTLAAPYSIYSPGPVEIAIAALMLTGFSLLTIAISIIAGLAQQRKEQPKSDSASPFNLALLIWSIVQIISVPVLLLAMILLLSERLLSVGVFDPRMGGDPLLYKHLFWFCTHPSAIVTLLLAIGVVWKLVPDKSAAGNRVGKPTLYSMAAIGLFSVLSWGLHLATGGQAAFASAIFGLFGILMAVPLSIILIAAARRVIVGATADQIGSWYAIVILVALFLGAPTGVILSTLSTNAFFHGTSFVTAHVHYLAIGCTVMAFLGGLHYVWPQVSRRALNPAPAKVALLVIISFGTLSFVAWLLRGLQGIPREMHGNMGDGWLLNALGSLGGLGVVAGIALILVYYLWALSRRDSPPPHSVAG